MSNQIELPEWLLTLVGRQTLEIEGLRRQLSAALQQPEQDEPASE